MMSKITVTSYESEGERDEFEICILKKLRSNHETLIVCVCSVVTVSSTLRTDEGNQSITPVGNTWSSCTSTEFPGR